MNEAQREAIVRKLRDLVINAEALRDAVENVNGFDERASIRISQELSVINTILEKYYHDLED